MALDRQFPAAQASGGQAPAQPILQQTTPLAYRQQRKRHKGTSGVVIEDSTPPVTRQPTEASGWSAVPPTNTDPQETQTLSQHIIIDSQVMASSLDSAVPWECTFQLRDKALPSNSYLRTQRNGEGGQVSDSLGQALLLSTNMEHYSSCRDDDLVLKLKSHTIAVRFTSTQALLLISTIVIIISYILFFFFYKIHKYYQSVQKNLIILFS